MGEVGKSWVQHNSGNNEWYTPSWIISRAIDVLGNIDCDPASSATANAAINAAQYFTLEDDGLEHDWFGTVWLNPPHQSKLVKAFANKLVEQLGLGNTTQALVLVNNATETGWFQLLFAASNAACFLNKRVRYWSPERESRNPLQGQVVLYFGGNVQLFRQVFERFGTICTSIKTG